MLLLLNAALLLGCPGGPDDDDSAAPSGCIHDSPSSSAACVDAAAYAADLEVLAVERPSGSAGWQTAQDHCASVLGELGFDLELHAYGSGTNVVGTLQGSGTARRAVVISAHYDSVEGCAGADDNASGVAGALGVARALATGSWTHDLVVACWDQEESGLIGSRAWAARAVDAGTAIDVAVSLEMIGYTDDAPDSQQLPSGVAVAFPDALAQVEANGLRGDFIALVSDPGALPMAEALAQHAPSSLPTVRLDVPPSLVGSPLLSDLSRSDHASFWERGVPAVMVTDTANFRYGGYHCGDGPDTTSRLDLAFAADVTRAVAGAAAVRLGVQD